LHIIVIIVVLLFNRVARWANRRRARYSITNSRRLPLWREYTFTCGPRRRITIVVRVNDRLRSFGLGLL
jgi:hypothetical protein